MRYRFWNRHSQLCVVQLLQKTESRLDSRRGVQVLHGPPDGSPVIIADALACS